MWDKIVPPFEKNKDAHFLTKMSFYGFKKLFIYLKIVSRITLDI